ncbi:MAG: rod shape-determining protein MreC [Rikenellaceae bacterium]
MFRFFEFIRSTYVVALFIIAEAIAIGHYAGSSSYTRAKIFVISASMTGGVSRSIRSTIRLFELPKENLQLTERIAELESQIDSYAALTHGEAEVEDLSFEDPAFTYTVAKVVSNSINKRDNFIVVDKGIEDGIYEKMAVITPTGEMLGYVAGCVGRYSAVLSILSHSFTTSGKVLGGNNYGSIRWEGKDRYRVSMTDLSKYEHIEAGDTIVSTGFSNIFPGGVKIGTVASFEFNEMQTAYNVEIDLAAEITAIDYVLLVGSRDSGEIEALIDDMGKNY